MTAPPGDGHAVRRLHRRRTSTPAEVAHVAVHADGDRASTIAAADRDRGARHRSPDPPLPEPLPAGADPPRCRWARFVGARSGDKGGDANVGLWVAHATRAVRAGWRSTLTVDELRELLPETADLDVDGHLLPNLGAVNFVIHGCSARAWPLDPVRPAGQGARRVAARSRLRRHPGGMLL